MGSYSYRCLYEIVEGITMSLMDTLDMFDDARPTATKELGINPAIKNWMAALPASPTGRLFLRASAVSGLCPREFVLNYWNPINNRWFDPSSVFKMDCGTWFHGYLQNRVLGPMGIIQGTWIKRGHDELDVSIVEGYHPDPEGDTLRIHAGENPLWEYQEYQVWNGQYRIKGHIDGIICLDRMRWLQDNLKLLKADFKKALTEVLAIPQGKKAILEIKSMSAFGYKAWDTPEQTPEYYKIQANIYQWLAGVDQTYFLLAERDMFKIKGMTYKHESGWVKDSQRKARIVWESIRDRKLPESAMACRTPKDKRATDCTHANNCWAKWTDERFTAWTHTVQKAQPALEWLDLSGVSYDT